MAKLKHSTEITEKRSFGKMTIDQSLDIEVDYNEQEHTFNVENVRLYENGKFVAEISKLLYKAPGNPLNTILDSIDWKEIYLDYKEEQEERFSKLPDIAPVFQDSLNFIK